MGSKLQILDVVAVNISQEIVMLSNNTIIPIASYFDCEGEYCEPNEAIVVVAGKEGLGWWSVNVKDFDIRSAH